MVKLNSLFPFILLILFSTKIETTNSDESNFDHDIKTVGKMVKDLFSDPFTLMSNCRHC
jgi:hypothetical protein